MYEYKFISLLSDPMSSKSRVDLLQAIEMPQGSRLGVVTDINNISGEESISYVTGVDGYPSFLIKRDADIRKSAGTFIQRLNPSFAILATVIPLDTEGGFLFAIVDPESVIQLGVSLLPSRREGHTDILLYHTDYRTGEGSQVLAKFSQPSFVKRWTSIGLKVEGTRVSLYLDCFEVDHVILSEPVQALEFDPGSELVIGSGGYNARQEFAVSHQ